MAITFAPPTPVFAAECSAVDISQQPSRGEVEAIDAGMDKYAVLVFHRDTPLSTE